MGLTTQKYIIIEPEGYIYQAEKTPEQIREYEFKLANDQPTEPHDIWNPIQFWDKSVPIV